MQTQALNLLIFAKTLETQSVDSFRAQIGFQRQSLCRVSWLLLVTRQEVTRTGAAALWRR
jgi:hypothetical protein